MAVDERFRGLPDEDYRFTLGISRSSVDEYFAPTADEVEILSERRHWFDTARELYAGLLPDGEPIAEEFCHVAADWIENSTNGSEKNQPDSTLSRLIHVSAQLEPDVVLIRLDESGRPVTVGGCVCFPSSWSLPEKLGLSVAEVHDIVPGMNTVVGARVDRLLQSLKPGEGWLRSNWSSEASPARNQHPRQPTPELTSPLDPKRVWLRREHQLLFRLPQTGGIVFGIRLELTALQQVLDN
ncbi:MAG: hypothetical protein B7Z55_08470, partial [Planctomycetales bacterium 12-60-4]